MRTGITTTHTYEKPPTHIRVTCTDCDSYVGMARYQRVVMRQKFWCEDCAPKQGLRLLECSECRAVMYLSRRPAWACDGDELPPVCFYCNALDDDLFSDKPLRDSRPLYLTPEELAE